MRKCERNNPAETQVSKEGGGSGALVARTKIHLLPNEKAVVKYIVPQQLMEYRDGVDIHTAAHEGSHTTAGRCSLKEAAACGEEPTLEQAPDLTCSPLGTTHAGTLCS